MGPRLVPDGRAGVPRDSCAIQARYQAPERRSVGCMPATELCVIHPGALSASCWARLASHLPAGTPVKVLELETINRFWADDPTLTVDALADRLRGRLGATRAPRVLVGWGVGGVVADALAAPAAPRRRARRARPRRAERRADRGAAPALVRHVRRRAQGPHAAGRPGAPDARAASARSAIAVGALRADTPPATVERCFEEHSARVLRDHRLTAGHTPSGTPLTVVKAARQPRPGEPRARLGPLRARSSASAAAATTTRCSPTAPPPPTWRCCSGAGSRRPSQRA